MALAPLRGLYAITPDEVDGERLIHRCQALLQAGIPLLQYRNKLADADQRRRQAAALLPLCRAAGTRLIINDHLPLALEIDADGVHLGGDDGDLVAARRLLGPGRLLGASCYASLERAARAADAGADYLAFGALFASPTKPQAPTAPLAVLAAARERFGLPVVGIGGIHLDNAARAIEAGADLLAVITDLFQAQDMASRARAYQELFK